MRPQGRIFYSRVSLVCFGEDDHYQIFCTIIIGIEIDFFGQRLAIVIKELGPQCVRGCNGFVAQFFKFKA